MAMFRPEKTQKERIRDLKEEASLLEESVKTNLEKLYGLSGEIQNIAAPLVKTNKDNIALWQNARTLSEHLAIYKRILALIELNLKKIEFIETKDFDGIHRYIRAVYEDLKKVATYKIRIIDERLEVEYFYLMKELKKTWDPILKDLERIENIAVKIKEIREKGI